MSEPLNFYAPGELRSLLSDEQIASIAKAAGVGVCKVYRESVIPTLDAYLNAHMQETRIRMKDAYYGVGWTAADILGRERAG